MPDRYAVLGSPVAHSLSPQIHTLFAAQTHQDLTYEKIEAPREGFIASVQHFIQNFGKGLNITLPFKEEAWLFATQKTERAEEARAVNTLTFENDTILGDNTDGEGFIRDLTQNHLYSLKGKQILLLSAGGAARGIMGPILRENPESLCLCNRTLMRAQSLVSHFSLKARSSVLQSTDYSTLTGRFDLIINATSASVQGTLPPLSPHIVQGTFCYDLMYSNVPTAFIQWAKQNNALYTSDGLGMLVEQAASAFYLWRGIHPDTSPVLAILQNARFKIKH